MTNSPKPSDPADARADGQFQAQVDHSTGRIGRFAGAEELLAWARKGNSLTAVETIALARLATRDGGV